MPCPSCGMTTSMSLMARGRVPEAARIHLFGVVLFPSALVLGAMWLAEAATGATVPVTPALRPAWWWLLVALGAMLVGWGVKLLVGFANGTLPLY